MIMSEHMGVDKYKDRSALVISDTGQYYVAYYKDDKLIAKIEAVKGESEADALAEEYCLGYQPKVHPKTYDPDEHQGGVEYF